MKRFLKWVGVLAAAVVLCTAGLFFYLKAKYPPEKIKVMAEEAVRQRLHRELKLGRVAFGWRGVTLENVELSERPNFEAGTFVSAQRVAVAPLLWPLLKGMVVIRSVELVVPRAQVTRFADGAFNFSDLLPASRGEPAQPPSGGAPAVLVGRVTVTEGEFFYEDRSTAPAKLSFHQVNFSARPTTAFLSPIDVAFSGEVRGNMAGKPVNGRASLKGNVAFLGATAVHLEELNLESFKTSLRVSGRVQDFQAPRMDLSVRVNGFDPASLAPFVALPEALKDLSASGDFHVKGATHSFTAEGGLRMAASGISSNLSFEASVKNPGENMSFTVQARAQDLAVDNSPLAPGLAISGPFLARVKAVGQPKKIQADVALEGDKAALRYKNMLSKAAGGIFQVAGHVASSDPFSAPFFDAKGNLDGLMLASSGPWPAGFSAQGPLALSFAARGTPQDAAVNLTVDAKQAAVAYGDILSKPAGVAMALRADVQVKQQKDAALRSAVFTLADLTMNGSGYLNDARGRGRMDLTLSAQPFAVNSLAPAVPMVKQYQMTGQAGADVSIKGTFGAPKIQGTLRLKNWGAVPREGAAFSGLGGDVLFTDNSVETNQLAGKLNGSALKIKSKLANFAKPDLFLEGQVDHIDAGLLLQALMSPAALAQPAGAPSKAAPASPAGSSMPVGKSGSSAAKPSQPAPATVLAKTAGSLKIGSVGHPHFTGKNFLLTWNLTQVGADMSRAGGAADFSAADGKIYDLPLAKKINALLNKDVSDITYQKIKGHFQVAQGVLETRDFTVDSSQTDILTQGRVALGPMTADLKTQIKLPTGALGGDAGQWFAGEDGRPTLEISLKGPLADPAVSINANKALKNAAEQYLKKGLQKLFNVPEESSAPVENSNQSAPPKKAPADKAIEKGLKSLDKLFKKQ